LARAGLSELAPLWVGGLMLLCLLVGHLLFDQWLSLSPKTYDWAQYLLLGTLFPLLIVGAALLPRQRWAGSAAARAGQAGLILLVLTGVGLLVVSAGEPLILPLAAAQVLVMSGIVRRGELSQPAQLMAGVVVAVLGWTLATPLLWWMPLHQALHASPVAFVAFTLLLLLVCAYVAGNRSEAGGEAVARTEPESADGLRLSLQLRSPAMLAGLAVIALFCLRTDGLFDILDEDAALYHWGMYVGPAELVRQGGWLLWDVPTPYGFLSVLMLALIPVAAMWQAFYLLNALLTFLVGAGLFLLLSRIRPGPVGWIVGLSTTLGALFFMPYQSQLPVIGTHQLPQGGPYRFIWCFVMLGVLLGELRTAPGSRAQRTYLFAGCVAWLLGILWSAETAIFGSIIWLPAYILIVLRDRVGLERRSWRSWPVIRRAVTWLAFPPLLLGGVASLLVAYYVARLGRLPDLRAYVDYVVAFGEGIAFEIWQPLLDPRGPVLAILLLLGLVAGAAVAVLRGVIPLRMLSLVVGLWGALWATASYFVVHYPYPSVIVRAAPFAVIAVALLLLLAARQREPGGWGFVLRTTAVPLLVMFPLSFAVMGAAVTNPAAAPAIVTWDRAVLRGDGNVERLLPSVEPALQELLDTVGVQANTPIVYGGSQFGNLMPAWRAADGQRVTNTRSWLSAKPLNLMLSLPDSRKAIYTSRFIDRTRLGGWLIQRKADGRIATIDPESNIFGFGYGFGADRWIFKELPRSHAPTRIYENGDWQLVWFDFVGENPDILRPTYPDWGLEALSPDIRVDGQRLSEVPNPELWALYGTGWEPAERGEKGRRMGSSAQLWIFSPSSRPVDLRIPSPTSDERRLQIATNGEAPGQVKTRQGGRVIEATIRLEAGWNEVKLTLHGQGATPPSSILIERIEIVT
jgi:hypothetical protein